MSTQDQTSPGEAAPSDHSLLQRYRRGSQDAALQLYLRYAQRLRSLAKAQISPALARRLDLDDLVQSVFKSFFRGVAKGLYDVPAGEEIWRLFLVIALNKIRKHGAYHHAAKRDVKRTCGLGERDGEVAAAADDDSAAFSFLQLVVDEALGKLTPPQRHMVELRLEGYEVAEIACRTSRSKRTVERLLQQARALLETFLKEES